MEWDKRKVGKGPESEKKRINARREKKKEKPGDGWICKNRATTRNAEKNIGQCSNVKWYEIGFGPIVPNRLLLGFTQTKIMNDQKKKDTKEERRNVSAQARLKEENKRERVKVSERKGEQPHLFERMSFLRERETRTIR